MTSAHEAPTHHGRGGDHDPAGRPTFPCLAVEPNEHAVMEEAHR